MAAIAIGETRYPVRRVFFGSAASNRLNHRKPYYVEVAASLALKQRPRLKQASPLLRLFGRPTTRRWEKLPCRISASDRDGRSDPIARCAHCYNTIAERRSDSTTGCGRVLS